MSNPEPVVAVMDQHVVGRQAADMIGAQTPLAHVGLTERSSKSSVASIVDSRAAAAQGVSTVQLVEERLTGILVLRAAAAQGDLSSALQAQLQLQLPQPLQSQENDRGDCIRWMSPDEWMLSCPIDEAFSIENKLRSAVNGHIAIVNVSGGYCLLTLSGADAINLLAKGCSCNLNPEHFRAGKVVNTLMAKAQITLRCLGEERYEILVRRSFADYLWLWLQRAGSEYGMQAAAGSS